MFPTPVPNGGPSNSAHPQQQYQQHSQHGQHSQEPDSRYSQPQHLHQQQAQFEAMCILQQQHMLPSLIATKQPDLGLLHSPPSGPWSSEDYDSMMRTILDATLPSDHFTDLEAPASLASFSASYAGSFVSGSSDSGASPNSINGLIYGTANFPTPPDSDLDASARNPSFSLALHNGAAFSPDGSLDLSTASYPHSYSGSDTTSPYAQNFNMHTSSTSPFGLQPVPLPSASISTNSVSPESASQLGDLSAPVDQQSNPNFFAPNTAGLQTSFVAQPPSQEPAELLSPTSFPQTSDTNASNRKRPAGDATGNDVRTNKPASKSGAKKSASPTVPITESADEARKTKKAKPTISLIEPKAGPTSSSAPINHLSSKLPLMEVGSNATALAAIERLKAKRLQESQAAASASAAGPGISQASASATVSDKTQLDPATRQQKKVAHNAIERRYRNNINDRLAALRRAVPALREIRPRKRPSGRRSRKAQQEEDLVDGVPAATKLNKATILGKATDYIKYLKSRELRLTSEVAGLRELVRSLEGGEELLELWEAEMDKFVAEQEALAAAAAAREEEEAEHASVNAEGDDDDDEDEDGEDDDDEGDTAEHSYASASSSSPPSARSRTGSKPGRGRRSGIGGALSSVASSRYMLATFLGISFIGSGTEFSLDASGSDASHAVSRPAAGQVIVGASRQLLKRSATYMAPTTSIAQDPHAFDVVPTHALAFEVLRIISFVFCFLFLIWPLFSRLVSKSRSASPSNSISHPNAEHETGRVGQSHKLRLALTRGDMDVAMFGKAVRTHIGMPTSAFFAAPSVVASASRLALSRMSRIQKLLPVQRITNEEAATLSRLLEVETLCENKALSSSLLRLHTALRVANSEHVRGPPNATDARDPVLVTPRLKATLALSFARLGEGIDCVQDLAEQFWTEARSSLRIPPSSNATASEAASPSALDKDVGLARSEDASWLSSVLSLDLDTALDLLASSSSSNDARTYDFSAVLAIADVYYCARLTDVWNRLLSSLVRASCPSVESQPSRLVSAFVSLQSKQRLDLDVIRDADERKELHAEITSLARTAPPTARAWQMAQVTLATWSAILGNLALARHVASILDEHPFSVDSNIKLASVATLNFFVDTDAALDSNPSVPLDDLDAKANLFLAWLRFLRTFADVRTDVKELYAATLQIRKLVAAVTTPANVVALADGEKERLETQADELETHLDLVTDLCTALGRRINRLPVSSSGTSPAKLLIDAVDDDRDSGIEV